MKKILFAVIAVIVTLILPLSLNAQNCKIKNNVFQGGEDLSFDLYFKYGLVDAKVGVFRIKVDDSPYLGQDAYEINLYARSIGTARKLISLSDTLTSYVSKNLVPLAFTKKAHEKGDFTDEKITYAYKAGGAVDIYAKRIKNGKLKFDDHLTNEECIYDFLSVVFYARTLDFPNMKKGATAEVPFMSGNRKLKMVIDNLGKLDMLANDGKTYECTELSLSIADDTFVDKKEALRVYLTNDRNRMPIRIDSKLKIGAVHAILKSYKGNIYPLEIVDAK